MVELMTDRLDNKGIVRVARVGEKCSPSLKWRVGCIELIWV